MVGPVVGSALGLMTVVLVILFTRRRQQRVYEARQDVKNGPEGEGKDNDDGRSQPPPEIVEPKELETFEIYEMPVPDPVGSELSTPRTGTFKSDGEEWPLPLSPLPMLFALTEMRDVKMGRSESPKHATYYNS